MKSLGHCHSHFFLFLQLGYQQWLRNSKQAHKIYFPDLSAFMLGQYCTEGDPYSILRKQKTLTQLKFSDLKFKLLKTRKMVIMLMFFHAILLSRSVTCFYIPKFKNGQHANITFVSTLTDSYKRLYNVVTFEFFKLQEIKQ